jgi:hypothetical protein
MGGASAWQYALHFPDRWAAVSAGAGFTETEAFLRNELRRQPQNAVQRRLWHLYDSTDYAINAFNVPIVAYSGGIDAQKQAADAMAEAMAKEGLTLEHIIGPNTGHAYEPVARQQIQDRLDAAAARGRTRAPTEIRFTTWTLKYNKAFWIAVDALGEHWERARVNAKVEGDGVTIATTNVEALRIEFDAGLAPFAVGAKPALRIDGAVLTLPPVARDKSMAASLIKVSGNWRLGQPDGGLRKRHGLQGPIDDAFMDTFVFVRPTGRAFSDALTAWERSQVDYAINEWAYFFRGERARCRNWVRIGTEPDALPRGC